MRGGTPWDSRVAWSILERLGRLDCGSNPRYPITHFIHIFLETFLSCVTIFSDYFSYYSHTSSVYFLLLLFIFLFILSIFFFLISSLHFLVNSVNILLFCSSFCLFPLISPFFCHSPVSHKLEVNHIRGRKICCYPESKKC